MNPESFVHVSTDGTHFEVNGAPFYFAGANCYYLMTRGADPNLRHEVCEVLDAVRAAGLTVMRTGVGCEGTGEWNCLQPSPGQFNEHVFRGLDFVLHEAAKRQIKLMLVIVNYWQAFGGMSQYCRWSCQRKGLPETDKADDFYADPNCQDIFATFLMTLAGRMNTITGIAYRDDPVIMAWMLANEPRCQGDYSGSILQNWIASSSEFLRSVDPNHMITAGLEGFLGSSTPELLNDNPYNAMDHGCDFARNHSSACIDFATIHIWPDNWMSVDDDAKMRFARRWINCHVNCCATLQKPLVITEFGKKPAGPARLAFYEKVYETFETHAQAGHPLAGSCLWMTAAVTYPDYDKFTVYFAPVPASTSDNPASFDPALNQLISRHAANMNTLNYPKPHTEL
ncbi:hypothetical protein WJX74_005452 [Apatococcus lobatus]|uniref:mannan endo-1,4-beta-mannosidase n=1 Tax=Apatococcus lobatus TaxID=904363 RepID=A0AAW1SBQ2_9CHLO